MHECILHCVSKQLYNFLMSSFLTILYTKIIEIGSFFNELLKKKCGRFLRHSVVSIDFAMPQIGLTDTVCQDLALSETDNFMYGNVDCTVA